MKREYPWKQKLDLAQHRVKTNIPNAGIDNSEV